MKVRLVMIALATLLVAGIAATAAPPAAAATTYTVNQTFVVAGTPVTVTGALTVGNFAASGNTLTATATFTGTVTVSGVAFPAAATLTVTASDINADCGSGTLTFNLTADLAVTQPFVYTYHLSTPVTINAGSSTPLRNLICQVAALLNGNGSSAAIADKLSVVLRKAA